MSDHDVILGLLFTLDVVIIIASELFFQLREKNREIRDLKDQITILNIGT
jgi:hypothetical protein